MAFWRFVITATLFVLMFFVVDVRDILHRVKSFDLSIALLCVGLFVLQLLLVSKRWQSLINRSGLPLRYINGLETVVIGVFMNNLLVNFIGAMIGQTLFLRSYNIPSLNTISVFLVEKVVVFLSLMFLSCLGLLIAGVVLQAKILMTGALLVGLAFCVGLAVLLLGRSEWLRQILLRVKLFARYGDVFYHVLGRFDRQALLVVLLTLLSQGILIGAACVIGLFVSDALSVWEIIVFMPVASLLASLPISIGGWGIREWATMYGGLYFGATMEEGVVIGFFVGVFSLMATVTTAAILVLLRGRRIVLQLKPNS